MNEPTEPNTARMFDCWLGGSHHFPIDAEAARNAAAIIGDAPKLCRILRSFLLRASQHLADDGIDQFLVFGAGIPACGTIHETLPRSRVLYTDFDAHNIAFGREIVAKTNNAAYDYCDATDLKTLNRAVLESALGPLRRLGVIAVGMMAFLDDDAARRLLADVYSLAPAGSMLAFDFDSRYMSSRSGGEELVEAGNLFHMREPAEFEPLLGSWSLQEPGILPVARWRVAEPDLSVPTLMYGGVAKKPG